MSASSAGSSSNAALTLSIPLGLYCSGSFVDGAVILDFRKVQAENIQEVHVKLRGMAQTQIHRDKATYRESQVLIYSNMSLWTQGSAYPPAGSDTLYLPFRFPLPENLPPSFRFDGRAKKASILYSLVAVGVRPGMFHSNRRIGTPLAILPREPVWSQLRTNLAAGWIEGWRTTRAQSNIRRGLWGDFSTVTVELSMPDIPVLPVFVDIPYTINIKTITAPLSRSKADSHPMGKPIFPAPPAVHSEVTFELTRRLKVRARGFSSSSESEDAFFLGENASASKTHVDTDIAEMQWVAASPDDKDSKHSDKEEMGTWVQQVAFRSKLRLHVPPAFRIPTCECDYFLYLKVPFPGIGNDVKIVLPVNVVSGIDAPILREQQPPPPFPSSGESASSSVPPPPASAQPPMLDLPPAYWDTNNAEWGTLFEKD